MIDIFKTLGATKASLEKIEIEEAKAWQAAEDLITAQKSKGVLDDELKKMFVAADVNGSGSLDRAEFFAVFQSLNFGLTKKEIKSLMVQIDKNEDGTISYDDFAPVALNIITEIIKEKLVQGVLCVPVLCLVCSVCRVLPVLC